MTSKNLCFTLKLLFGTYKLNIFKDKTMFTFVKNVFFKILIKLVNNKL